MKPKVTPFTATLQATHQWRGSGWKLDKCKECKKQTTGRLRDAVSGKESPLCSDCAAGKGFR